jgi:hypothetical protein
VLRRMFIKEKDMELNTRRKLKPYMC